MIALNFQNQLFKLNKDQFSNIVRNSLEELKSAGYNFVDAKKEICVGDLICLVNKTQDLWALFQSEEELKYYKKAMKNSEVGSSIILRE